MWLELDSRNWRKPRIQRNMGTTAKNWNWMKHYQMLLLEIRVMVGKMVGVLVGRGLEDSARSHPVKAMSILLISRNYLMAQRLILYR